ncbi:hypothetical protein [Paenibacillus kyungheensis]
MKKKTRTITVKEKTYIYTLKDSYQNQQWEVHLKITLQNQKNDALAFHFTTKDDVIAGCPLLTGITLYHRIQKEEVVYNLNHPVRVKELIEYGLVHQWTGEQTIVHEDGITVLNHIGYDSDVLRPLYKE